MNQFNDFLNQFQLTGSELIWDPFENALACFEEEVNPPDGVTHQALFAIVRGGMSWSGDERNFAGLFADAKSSKAVLYFADDASGSGKLWRVYSRDGQKVQSLISSELDDWGPLQFYGTTIYNEAQDLTPQSFFLALVQEAFDRHPDHIDPSDDECDTAEYWMEENYQEW